MRFHSRHRDRRKGLPGEWEIWQCKDCYAEQIVPLPTPKELMHYYFHYFLQHAEIPAREGLGDRYPRLRTLWHCVSGDVDPRDLMDVAAGERVLDYGCGPGTYMKYFANRGVQIEGVDVAGEAIAAAKRKGLTVHAIDLDAPLPFEAERFDHVYAMQVLEHLASPKWVLSELYRVLKPTGTALFAVPNSQSFWKRVFGEYWVSGWFAPYHLLHFGKKNLTLLLEQCGFSVDWIATRTPLAWWRLNIRALVLTSCNSVERARLPFESMVAAVAVPVLRLADVVLGGDCLVVHSTKRVGAM